jgi:hypothetical protein
VQLSLHAPAVHWQLVLQVSVREPPQVPQGEVRVVPGVQAP